MQSQFETQLEIQRQIEISLHNKIKVMEQIKGLKIPFDGGFMANYNNRSGKRKMEEEMKIDGDMINLKERTKTKKEEKAKKPEEMNMGKKKVKKQEEPDVIQDGRT